MFSKFLRRVSPPWGSASSFTAHLFPRAPPFQPSIAFVLRKRLLGIPLDPVGYPFGLLSHPETASAHVRNGNGTKASWDSSLGTYSHLQDGIAIATSTVFAKNGIFVELSLSGNFGPDISSQIRSYGGVAMILMSEETDGYTTHADVHVLPASNVNYADTSKILAYFNSSTNATATIVFKGTVIGKSTAPTIASFSSRGPNFLIPGVLKPDILGPGVDVLAAWPRLVGPTADASTDHRGFNVKVRYLKDRPSSQPGLR
ncbi:hypothetical protein J5N97_021679 [Dioscorea zingiberensis]|uniref:Uncharacterized protein n=1 Tax=Dioscorea zingiberensis TaxID=325984 RepID=A0A9D5CA16_9LILI|nr:hypothetical protein J5N97_021679 [Dioscorea zingiberensis]